MTEAYEEVLKKNGRLLFTPGGTSMMPLLRHHENPVLLEPCKGGLKKGDIPFYKRLDGQYVLHRIVRVRKDSYDCCGDNQTKLEKGVTDDMIFAKMVGFYKGEQYISIEDKSIVRYGRRRMASRPYRAFFAYVKACIKRILRKNK